MAGFNFTYIICNWDSCFSKYFLWNSSRPLIPSRSSSLIMVNIISITIYLKVYCFKHCFCLFVTMCLSHKHWWLQHRLMDVKLEDEDTEMRIERPTPKYPDGRRTSAPAILWSAASFVNDQVWRHPLVVVVYFHLLCFCCLFVYASHYQLLLMFVTFTCLCFGLWFLHVITCDVTWLV